jgi:hypothetical protein
MKTIDLCGAWSGKCILKDKTSFDFDGTVPGSAAVISANAIFDDNCFSLMPFETRTIPYQTAKDCEDAHLSVEAYTLKINGKAYDIFAGEQTIFL